jgi:hypothetical protein
MMFARIMLIAFASIGFVSLLAWCGFLAFHVLSKPICSQTATTEMEAKQAIVSFFSGDTAHSRRVISLLKKDRMTDESFAHLKAGCPGCYFFQGDQNNPHPGLWHVATEIAPRRTVVLLAECSEAVWIEQTLFGG